MCSLATSCCMPVWHFRISAYPLCDSILASMSRTASVHTVLSENIHRVPICQFWFQRDSSHFQNLVQAASARIGRVPLAGDLCARFTLKLLLLYRPRLVVARAFDLLWALLNQHWSVNGNGGHLVRIGVNFFRSQSLKKCLCLDFTNLGAHSGFGCWSIQFSP